MGRAGLKAARNFGACLPTFSNLESANHVLMAEKDRAISNILARTPKSVGAKLDFGPQSLLVLEEWYFQKKLWVPRFLARGIRRELAQTCAYYFGEVVVRSLPGAQWVVEQFAFDPSRFTIGVQHGLCTMTLTTFYGKLEHPENIKKDSMWRTYQCYFARNPEVSINF